MNTEQILTNFINGFWVKTFFAKYKEIDDIIKWLEQSNLKQEENIEDIDFDKLTEEEFEKYLDLIEPEPKERSVSIITKDIPITTFGIGERFGLIFKADLEERIKIWYDGLNGEKFTNEITENEDGVHTDKKFSQLVQHLKDSHEDFKNEFLETNKNLIKTLKKEYETTNDKRILELLATKGARA